jgi:pimeloyl-ACP methyl ester carboxylesterase
MESGGPGVAARLAAALLALSLVPACTPSQRVPAAPPSDDVTFEDGTRRVDLRFPCGEDTCAGWLFLPPGVERPPVVVMGTGFSGTRVGMMPLFARVFASRGLAAFAFDYRHFGDSGGAPRQLVDPWAQLDDWRSALAFVRTLGEVDAERLALWGTSMGGGLVVMIGAEDPGVSAIVAQVPGLDTDVEPSGWQTSLGWGLRLLFTAWADLVKSTWSDEPLMIHAFAPPGEFGMIVDDVSYAGIQKAIPEGWGYRNEIAARSILTFDDYNPADSWESVDVPTLVFATRQDRLAPYEAVEAFARVNDRVVVETFEGGHFEMYVPPVVDRAAEVEARFLLRAFGISGRAEQP